MSRVSKPSKAYGAHIKVSTDATDGKEKPYIGSRRGRGMPSAHEPVEELTEQGRKNFDKIFDKGEDDYINNAESQEKRRKRERKKK